MNKNSNFNNILSESIIFERGTTPSTKVKPNSSTDVVVTFSKVFPQIPTIHVYVIKSISDYMNGDNQALTSVEVKDVTHTSCLLTISFLNTGSSYSTNAEVLWNAEAPVTS